MQDLSEYDQEALGILSGFEDRAGYLKIQQTRPQTLAYGLTDSPAGRLAWNSELSWGSAVRAWMSSIATGSSPT